WTITNPLRQQEVMSNLVSLTELEDLKYFSGETIYRSKVRLDSSVKSYQKVQLDLGRVCELAEVRINGRSVGVKMWSPYQFDITPYLDTDTLHIEVSVTNSKANEYVREFVDSGLIGPVTLKYYS
ncbi:MAG TPA: hypothetical protein VNR61_04875, partial [Niallia sp.]|nr:hypothetical protein [Niallia sp.]